jgi:rare lipoprotein A
VKVTDMSNGRSVNVRINDRGPYVSGRSLDLSGRAAEKIGLADKGVAKVKITPQQAAASTSAPPAPCD